MGTPKLTRELSGRAAPFISGVRHRMRAAVGIPALRLETNSGAKLANIPSGESRPGKLRPGPQTLTPPGYSPIAAPQFATAAGPGIIN
jgi:hypothetical protein